MPIQKKKITPEIVETIRVSVTEENLSHREIAKKIKEIHGVTLSYKLAGNVSRFFNFEPKKKTRRVTTHVHRKRYLKRENVIDHRINYDFLENLRYIFNHYLSYDNDDINQEQLELLLYLYPKYVFSKEQFYKHCKELKVPQRHFGELTKKGYLKTYRSHITRKQKTLYAITDRTKILCNNIHLACTGELKIEKKDKTKSELNLIDIIKSFNER